MEEKVMENVVETVEEVATKTGGSKAVAGITALVCAAGGAIFYFVRKKRKAAKDIIEETVKVNDPADEELSDEKVEAMTKGN